MAALVTWELYSSLHNKVTEEQFEGKETMAEFEVRQVIGPRFDSITSETYGYRILQEAICNTIDRMEDEEKSGAGKGLASVTNDGYSETYKTSTPEEATAERRDLIKSWLQGTGLTGAY